MRNLFWLLPLGLVLNYLAARHPVWVELLYARGLYPLLGQIISRTTALLPVSLAEIIIVAILVLVPLALLRWLWCNWWRPRQWLKAIASLLSWAGLLYFAFVLLWALNYHRQPLAQIIDLTIEPSTPSQLVALCADLLQQANDLRQLVTEDEHGVFQLSGGKWRALTRAHLGYEQIAPIVPALGGRYGAPKGVYLSHLWSYTGIAGIYFPFTGEANVNMAMPAVNIPATACHEMAHQRGFAREDEANYIAYAVCRQHPDVEFQYSGTFLALSHAMQALRRQDKTAYDTLVQQYGPGLQRDMQANQTFWMHYAGPLERRMSRLNDVYLKSHRQSDGIQSYGRMVDLLLAEWKQATKMP